MNRPEVFQLQYSNCKLMDMSEVFQMQANEMNRPEVFQLQDNE